MKNTNLTLLNDALTKSRNRFSNFVNPGPIPEDLAYVPGFVEDLVNWTLYQSHSPNRTLAFAGALAMLAHLSGRTFTDASGTRTNLYVIALAPSGSGKESPRSMNNLLAKSLGISRSIMDNVASGEALEDELVKMPSLLLQSDEIAMLFGQMRGQGRISKALSGRLTPHAVRHWRSRGTARRPYATGNTERAIRTLSILNRSRRKPAAESICVR